MSERAIETGERWYWAGKHWTVLEQTTRDGAPAVKLRADKPSPGAKWDPIINVKNLARHGAPSGE